MLRYLRHAGLKPARLAVQDLRQAAGYKPGQKAKLMAELPTPLLEVMEKNQQQFKRETSLSVIEFKRGDKFDAEITTKLDEVEVWLGIKK